MTRGRRQWRHYHRPAASAAEHGCAARASGPGRAHRQVRADGGAGGGSAGAGGQPGGGGRRGVGAGGGRAGGHRGRGAGRSVGRAYAGGGERDRGGAAHEPGGGRRCRRRPGRRWPRPPATPPWSTTWRPGTRPWRGAAAEALLREATGAEAALAVNNAAGGAAARPWRARPGPGGAGLPGELIEIGGEFRLPQVMEAAGVVLREVGTTNRTHLRDYAAGFGPETGLVLALTPVQLSGRGVRHPPCPGRAGRPGSRARPGAAPRHRVGAAGRRARGRAVGRRQPARRRRPGAVLRRQAPRGPAGRSGGGPGRAGRTAPRIAGQGGAGLQAHPGRPGGDPGRPTWPAAATSCPSGGPDR